MKTVEQIIGYLEGVYDCVKNYDPPRVEKYFIERLLAYIKEED